MKTIFVSNTTPEDFTNNEYEDTAVGIQLCWVAHNKEEAIDVLNELIKRIKLLLY